LRVAIKLSTGKHYTNTSTNGKVMGKNEENKEIK
jgi:hypothetical protein